MMLQCVLRMTPPRTNMDPRWFVLSRSLQVDETRRNMGWPRRFLAHGLIDKETYNKRIRRMLV